METYIIADSARRNQRHFRILLLAMSRPGRLFRLDPTHLLLYPFPALAVAECLMDHEVSFGVAGAGATEAFATAVLTATGARPTPPEEANFLFVVGRTSRGALRRARRGRPEFPCEGATLVYCLGAESEPDTGRRSIRLSGPGIAEPDGIAPEMPGLSLEELDELGRVNADYPLGVDSIFIQATGRLMCLPRSTRIRVG